MGTARTIITKGCEECPKNEDVWLEAARLNTKDNAKIILANAVRHIPQSVKVWLKAVDLETEGSAQKRVLRRALEFIPNSLKLWRAAINMEDNPNDAKVLLSRAVELVPLSVELWLALARLEIYANAKKVLNNARKNVPTSHEIWIAAARLEEQQGNEKMVDTIIKRAVEVLSQSGTVMDRDQWLVEAENCEKTGAIGTCQSIIRATIELGIEEEDRKKTWMRYFGLWEPRKDGLLEMWKVRVESFTRLSLPTQTANKFGLLLLNWKAKTTNSNVHNFFLKMPEKNPELIVYG
jgi:pre-mRNA-processing factor 6